MCTIAIILEHFVASRPQLYVLLNLTLFKFSTGHLIDKIELDR